MELEVNGRLVAVWYLEPTYAGILYTTAVTTRHGRSSSSASGSVSDWSLWPWWRSLTLHGIRQSTTRRRRYVTCSDDREVSWAAIALPRPCQSMAWSDGIWIIYRVTYAYKRVLVKRIHRLCTWYFSRSLNLHISMCTRRSSNRLVLPAYARFHPSCCWTKIARPVPSCNSVSLSDTYLLLT